MIYQAESSVEALNRRLALCETEIMTFKKRYYRFRLFSFALLLIGFVGISIGAKSITHTEEVKAERIFITNSTGTKKAEIRARSDGKDGIEIRSGTGRLLLRIPESDGDGHK